MYRPCCGMCLIAYREEFLEFMCTLRLQFQETERDAIMYHTRQALDYACAVCDSTLAEEQFLGKKIAGAGAEAPDVERFTRRGSWKSKRCEWLALLTTLIAMAWMAPLNTGMCTYDICMCGFFHRGGANFWATSMRSRSSYESCLHRVLWSSSGMWEVPRLAVRSYFGNWLIRA